MRLAKDKGQYLVLVKTVIKSYNINQKNASFFKFNFYDAFLHVSNAVKIKILV
jgi:hypothetical protein